VSALPTLVTSTSQRVKGDRLFKLIIADAEAIPPPTVNSQAEVWRDNDGAVCAYGQMLGEEYWMHLPGLASFRLSSRAEEVTAVVPGGISEELVLDAYRRSVLPMALQVCGREVLHASAIRTQQGVLALCGISETGKSTIAFGLSRRGYALWADDAVPFEISGRSATVISLPFEIRLRPPAAALFDLETISTAAAAGKNGALPGTETSHLLAVCVLRRAEGAASPVAVRRLSSAQAFAAVLTHAYCFTLQDRERKRRMIRHYLDLVAGVPIFDVCFQSGLANVPAVLDAIEQLLIARPFEKSSRLHAMTGAREETLPR
jgi:hypothetical protein